MPTGYRVSSLASLPVLPGKDLYVFVLGNVTWDGGLLQTVEDNFAKVAANIGSKAAIIKGHEGLQLSWSMDITQYRLAKGISVPQRRISEIVKGTRSITADTALRLGRFFGMEAQFWLNLQARYDLLVAESELAGRLDDEVDPHAA